ncbi:hypothetical protein D3C87_677230 [compost metagenome]
MGFNQRTALHQHLAGGIAERRLAAVAVEIQTTIPELDVGDIGGGGHQVAHIDLAAAAEHDAVAVDQHHRAVALDLALDLTGACVRIVDTVEHGPIRLLSKFDCGISPDVEGLPVENGLVGRLLDLHVGLAIGLRLLRAFGVQPTLSQAVVDLEAALAQPVRNGLQTAQGHRAPGSLSRLLCGNGRHGVVEGLQRALQLLVGFLLLRQGWRHPRQTSRTGPGGRGLLRSALGREPARAERGRRLGTAGYQTQCHRVRQGLEQPQRRIGNVTPESLAGDIATGWASEHHYEILFDCHTKLQASKNLLLRHRLLARATTERMSHKLHD